MEENGPATTGPRTPRGSYSQRVCCRRLLKLGLYLLSEGQHSHDIRIDKHYMKRACASIEAWFCCFLEALRIPSVALPSQGRALPESPAAALRLWASRGPGAHLRSVSQGLTPPPRLSCSRRAWHVPPAHRTVASGGRADSVLRGEHTSRPMERLAAFGEGGPASARLGARDLLALRLVAFGRSKMGLRKLT